MIQDEDLIRTGEGSGTSDGFACDRSHPHLSSWHHDALKLFQEKAQAFISKTEMEVVVM